MNDEKKMNRADKAELAMLTAEVARLERENETLRQGCQPSESKSTKLSSCLTRPLPPRKENEKGG